MLVTFILVVHALISLGLVGVILLQQSEGGGLGIGSGSAGGMMTARGAANLLTRSTMILASLFVLTSIVLALLAATSKRGHVIDTSLAKPATAAAPALFPKAPPKPANPADSVPLAN